MWGFEGRFLNGLSEENHQVYLYLKDALYRVGVKNHLHLKAVRFHGVDWDPDDRADVPIEYLDYALSEGLLLRNVVYAYFTWGFSDSRPETSINVIRCPDLRIGGLEQELAKAIAEMRGVLPATLFSCRYLENCTPPRRRTPLLGENTHADETTSDEENLRYV
ncbi:MAG: hypothetical protein ABIJ21_08840 [Nanoarchaeota archaeon]